MMGNQVTEVSGGGRWKNGELNRVVIIYREREREEEEG